jgi:hypothetical protein
MLLDASLHAEHTQPACASLGRSIALLPHLRSPHPPLLGSHASLHTADYRLLRSSAFLHLPLVVFPTLRSFRRLVNMHFALDSKQPLSSTYPKFPTRALFGWDPNARHICSQFIVKLGPLCVTGICCW